MGLISSKLIKHDSKSSKVSAAIQTEIPKETTQIPDVRSPTAEITRTPIIVEKLPCELDTPKEYTTLLKNKLLKNLKLDPRSPTVGIYRTPIVIEDTPSNKTTPNNFESPISIYSCNINDSLVEDVMTPIEPSVNVSGFEFPKEIFCGEVDVILDSEETKADEHRSHLKVSDKPHTYEARKLLDELISDEETFLKKVKMPSRKSKKSYIKNKEKSLSEMKGKFRSPLSNITLSTNSPNNITTGMKLIGCTKIIPEFGAENLASSNIKTMAQWDQNNTVII